MKDRDFLIWIHEQLEYHHKENPFYDYMHKLRVIIKATPKDKETPNCGSCNDLDSLLKELKEIDDAKETLAKYHCSD